MERIIFRLEKNPYMPETECYLAVLPDEAAGYGRTVVVPFFFDKYGTAWFEPCAEVCDRYYLNTKIIHKRDSRIPKLLDAVCKYFNEDFSVCEKRN